MRSAFFVVVALTACGGSSPARPSPARPSPAPPLASSVGGASDTLAAALAREVGGGHSVAIVCGPSGVRAVSSDGARQRTLVADGASWLLIDQRADVIWFGKVETGVMRAIDLDAPADQPVEVHTVVTGIPDPRPVSLMGAPRYGVRYPDGPRGAASMTGDVFATSATWDQSVASVELAIAAEPVLAGSSGGLPNREWEAQLSSAVIRDRPFVVALLARPAHHAATEPKPPVTHVDGVHPAACQDHADCGRAEPIAGTHYWRVVIASATGKLRNVIWQLYDADAHRMLDAAWADWLDGVWVAPDHTGFVYTGVVVRFDDGPLSATPTYERCLGGGWLGGGTFYD